MLLIVANTASTLLYFIYEITVLYFIYEITVILFYFYVII